MHIMADDQQVSAADSQPGGQQMDGQPIQQDLDQHMPMIYNGQPSPSAAAAAMVGTSAGDDAGRQESPHFGKFDSASHPAHVDEI